MVVFTDSLIIGICFLIVGLPVSLFIRHIEDDDKSLSTLLIITTVAIGIIAILEGLSNNAKIHYYEREIKSVERGIEKTKQYCKHLKYGIEKCNETFLYKLNKEKIQLEHRLNDALLEHLKNN